MADVKQTIQDFYKVLQTKDMARNYNFRVLDVSNKGVSVFTEDDLVYVQSASVPGKTNNPISVPYSAFTFRIPGGISYTGSDGYSLTFYLNQQGTSRIALENWLEETFNDANSTGDGILHNDSTITLAQLDNEFEIVRTYKLFGVFPVNVAELSYEIASADAGIITFQAQFAYQFFRRDNEIDTVINKIGKL